MKEFLAYLFGSSQVENEVEETKSAIERIMEEAEEQEPLKVERKPLQTALKSLDISGELEYDPEGFSLVCSDEADYRRYTEILLSPDAMEKLAKLGWVVTRCGDVAMTNEPAEFRIRFLEVTTAGEDGESKDSWPAPNPKLVTGLIKKGREFMDEPGPHDEDGPVEYDDKTSDDNQKGVGKAAAGKDPEGKPKGSGKSESMEDRLTGKQDQAFGNMKKHPYPANQQGKEKRRFNKWSKAGGRWQDKAMSHYGTKSEAQELAESILVNEEERCPHCEGQGFVDDEGNPKNEDMAAGDPSVHKCPRCKGRKTMPKTHAARYKGGVERKVSQNLGKPWKFEAEKPIKCPNCGRRHAYGTTYCPCGADICDSPEDEKGSGEHEEPQSHIGEARHKAGCQCGFCKNLGSFGKKKEEKPEETDDSSDVEEGKLEVTQKPFIGKDGKQRMVPWVGKPKPKKEESAEPQRYDDMFEVIKAKKKLTKPKSGGKVPKTF